MGQKLVKFLRGQIITSVIYLLLGAALVFVPVETVNVICKIVFGVMLAASGLIHIILYVLDRPATTVFDLFSGVILVVFGVFLFQNPLIVVKLLPVLLGGFVLGDCIWTLRGAIRLKKAKSGAWKWLLLATVLFLGLGIAMIVNPFTVLKQMIIFCGAVLLANGVLDLILQFVQYRGFKNAEKRSQELAALDEEKQNAEEMTPDSPEEPVYEDWNDRDTGTDAGVSGDAGVIGVAGDTVTDGAHRNGSGNPDAADREDTNNQEKSSGMGEDTPPEGENTQENPASLEPEPTMEPELTIEPELTLEPDLGDPEQN